MFILTNAVWNGLIHRSFGALPWYFAAGAGVVVWVYRLKRSSDSFETASFMMILLVAAYGADFIIYDVGQDG